MSDGEVIIEREFPKHEICRNCGFVHMNPIPNFSLNMEFYSEEYWAEHHGLSQLKRDYNENHRQKNMHRWLAPLISNNGKLLEIGCGYGFNLDYLKKRNPRIEFEGLEISKEGCRNTVESFNIICHNVSLEEFDPQGQYDFIIMCHVLEHFEDPNQAIAKVSKMLKQHGVLWVEVPNILFPNPRKRLVKWLSKEHISYFSPSKVRFLLEKNGLEVSREEHRHFTRFMSRKIETNYANPNLPNEYKDVKRALRRHKLLNSSYTLFGKFGIELFKKYKQ